MAFSDHRELQEINQVVEALNSSELRTVFYLCEASDTDNNVTYLKEMLKRKVMLYESGHLLKELMVHLRRFDILRQVCKTSREEAERSLKNRQIISRFRVLMANISEDMAGEDLNSVKFLLSSSLPREKIEKAKTFLDVVIECEKLDIVSPERVNILEGCLKDIGRVDLARKVTAYKMPVAQSGQHSFQQPKCRVPRPFPPSNGSHSPQQTRQVRPHYRAYCPSPAAENTPVSVYRKQSFQKPLEMYKLNSNPRGVCVIIDCVGNDGDMLEQTFKALHFRVFLFKWLSVDDTLSVLRGRQREDLEGDCFVCCVISRGTANHLLGTDSFSDCLRLDGIRRLFTADACPKLAGKPKLFFIQRYSVPEFRSYATMEHRDEDLETDGCDGVPICDLIPTDADVFWSHCWTDESQLEQGHHRSIYLKALTDALQKGQRRETHLVDVHTEVNGAIFEHNKRNPGAKYHIDLKHTLRKNLFLQ